MRYGNSIWKLTLLFVLSLGIFSATTAQDEDREIVFVTGWYYYNIAIASSNEIFPVTNEEYFYSRLSTPQWSPNVQQIAFTDDKNIFMVNVDGSNLEQLTDYGNITGQTISNISWSPNGQTIAATLYDGHKSYSGFWIRLIDLETMREHNVTSGEYTDGQFGISWSPDGKTIVFTSNRNSQIPDASGLYLLDVESGVVSALTDVSTRRRDDQYPSWSPDGKQIAFITTNDDNGGWDIYLFDVANAAFERFTYSTNAPEVSGNIYGSTIDWSPDGEQIVFSACPDRSTIEGCNLYTMRADGTEVVQITRDEANGEVDPSWNPKPRD